MQQKKLPFLDEIAFINSLAPDELKVALLATFRGYTPWQGLRLAWEFKKIKKKKKGYSNEILSNQKRKTKYDNKS